MKKLTPRQLAFISAYQGVANGNATQAAKMAGYSAKSATVTGSKLLSNPRVAANLKVKAANVPNIAKPDDILQYLTETMLDKDVSHGNRLRAAKQLQQAYGMQIAKVEIEAEVASTEVTMDLSKLTTDQLLSWAELAEAAQEVEPTTEP